MNNFEGMPDFNENEGESQTTTEETPKNEKTEESKEKQQKQEKYEEQEKLLTAEELGKMNYYERLGVSENADIATIKKAYRKASVKYHPDKTGGERLCMQLINEAKEVLEDPDRKRLYDAKLSSKWNQESADEGYEYEQNGDYDGEGIVPPGWKGRGRHDKKGNKDAKKKSAATSYSSYSSGSGGTKAAEPEKPKEEKKKPNFLARFFERFWKGVEAILSGLSI